MQRPVSIVNFERVVLISLALGILNTFLSWDKMSAKVAEAGMSTGSILGIQAVVLVLYLILIWFIARKGAPVAKWIYVVLSLIGIVGGVLGLKQMSEYGTLNLVISVVQYVLLIISLWLLFRPDSKAWFSDGRGGDEADPYR